MNLRKEFCYLTPHAEFALVMLAEKGLTDRDLALEVLELLWPDSEIYDLGEGWDGQASREVGQVG